MSRLVSKSATGVSVSASQTDIDVSAPFVPNDPWHVVSTVVLSDVSETTGITFSLKDSYDGGSTFYPVGSESSKAIVKKTFTGGVAEVTSTTWPAHSAAANGDYLLITAAQTGTRYAAYLNKRVLEVQTLTFPDKATAANGDYIVVENAAGTKFAVALTKPVAEVQTLTYADKAGTTDGDFLIVEDAAGIKYALAADTTGGAATTPAGPLWTAADHKALVNISGATDAASVAALMEIGWNALTGFTAAITTDDTAANGTMTLTQVNKGPVTDPVPKNATEAGAGSMAGAQSTAGVAAQTPTGAAWTAATYKGLADISGDTTAAQVAARAETALNALTGFTTSITSDDTAANGTMLLTQVTYGPTTNPVPKDYNDAGAGTITGVQTTAGVTTGAVPSGAAYTNAHYKIVINIEPGYTAAQVGAAARAALVANAAYAADFTTGTLSTATFTITQVRGGTVTDPAPKREDDGGVGSIQRHVDVQGASGGAVDLTTEIVTVSSHGFVTGDRIIAKGSLPVGLTSGSTYYVIKTDANNLKFATTQANALAGTAINLTDYGAGTCTLYQATYEIRMYREDSSDLAQLPIWGCAKVVANTGASDSCTVSAVYLHV